MLDFARSEPGSGGESDMAENAAIDRERGAFAVVTVLLLGLWLVPIWTNTFPPLQDYPYHLAQVAVLCAADDPASPFAAHFEADLGLRPYAAFYLVATPLARALPLEVAGRVAVSVPALLLGALLLGGLRRRNATPWGALVLVPLSQGLSYHLGFVNYLWSLPLLGLALEDLSRFAEADARAGARLAVWLAVWLGGLYLSHPFTFLGFLGLGALRLLFSAPGARVRGALLLTLSGLVFGLWFALADGGRGATGPEGIVWLPVAKSFLLLTLPLGGMYGGGEPAWAPLFVWLAIGAILLHAAWRERGSSPERRFWTLALFLLVVATFVAPFRAGHYSYINARLPDVSFLCLAIAAGTLRLPVASRVACTALVAGALVLSVLQQQRVAHELEEVAPLFEAIPRDAAVLPLVFDASSPELEPSVFDPHRHVHDMFHVRRGGGVTPYFFPHPLAPVRYRAGSPPAAPPQDRPAAYRFARHGGYAYLLVRAAPPRVLRRLLAHSEQVAASGSWLLLRGRDRAATAGQHSIGVTVSRPNGRQPASEADP